MEGGDFVVANLCFCCLVIQRVGLVGLVLAGGAWQFLCRLLQVSLLGSAQAGMNLLRAMNAAKLSF